MASWHPRRSGGASLRWYGIVTVGAVTREGVEVGCRVGVGLGSEMGTGEGIGIVGEVFSDFSDFQTFGTRTPRNLLLRKTKMNMGINY